jgi:glycosyltransferase involved in cell wall biosynthesis
VVRNLPDVAEFKELGPEYASRERVVTYVGGLNPNRGLWEMLEASNLLDPPARFELGGPFEPPELAAEVVGRTGMENVELLGFLSRSEVKAAMDRARVGLVVLRPNKNYLESQPVKMYEYMAAGIPVVTSNFPVWREIVVGNKCGITVDPTNPDEIAKAIGWLLDHPREAQQMGENGRAAVLNGLEWSTQFEALEALYRSVLSA